MNFRQNFLLLIFLLWYAPIFAQVDTAWVRRYNGPDVNDFDEARAVAVDASGNVYVTGRSWGPVTEYDFVTIKYKPNGDTLWVRRYDGPGNSTDNAFALGIDDSGNLYVTGQSFGSGTDFDYATIKYAPDGDTVWVRRYNGPANDIDFATALVVDDSGNVYVTGRSEGSGVTGDYATIKYASNGDTIWVRRYNGPANQFDYATAVAVDDSGNVYVTGHSWGDTTSFDYATVKYAPNGDTLWVRHYNGPSNGDDRPTALVADDSGQVYVSGISVGGFLGYDYLTIKYAPNGDTLWVRRYDGPGNIDDQAKALAIDQSGNVYVTGGSVGSVTGRDFATIKYTPNGDTVWVRRYNGPLNDYDFALDLALDGSGNVYVTGGSYGSGTDYDYATIKYTPDGNTAWIRRYDGSASHYDEPFALAVDNSGNVYVTGRSNGSGTSADYATIKYVQFTCIAKPGDVTGDGQVLLPDIVAIINFLFKSQPAPNPLCRGDANGNGTVLLPDIVYLINFIFRSGAAPIKSQACCL